MKFICCIAALFFFLSSYAQPVLRHGVGVQENMGFFKLTTPQGEHEFTRVGNLGFIYNASLEFGQIKNRIWSISAYPFVGFGGKTIQNSLAIEFPVVAEVNWVNAKEKGLQLGAGFSFAQMRLESGRATILGPLIEWGYRIKNDKKGSMFLKLTAVQSVIQTSISLAYANHYPFQLSAGLIYRFYVND